MGPGLVAAGLFVAMVATVQGARDRPWDPPPCRGALTWGAAPAGTWWRLDPVLVDGTLAAQRLVLGSPGSERTRHVSLPVESFAAGPFDGRILVGTDDGRRSTLRLLDPAAGCAHRLGASSSVIRRATITPDRTAVIEFRLARADRAELGVFRRPLEAGRRHGRLLGPIRPDPRFGRTWTTEFTWSVDGRRLAVQSCGAVACRTRVIDPVDGVTWSVADPTHGELVGLTVDRLVLYEACGGLPCPLIAVDRAGRRTVLEAHAGHAAVAIDPDGRAVVVHETIGDHDHLRIVAPDGSGSRLVPADPHRRLVPGPGRAGAGVEGRRGAIAVGPGGRPPEHAGGPSLLRPIPAAGATDGQEVMR